MTPSDQPAYNNWARLREQQRLAADRDPHAEAVDIFDLGEYNDIHPLRKKEVAERVSRCLDGIK
jgi:sialate O-acetylesterase